MTSYTYTTTGRQTAVILNYSGDKGVNRCQVKGGASDVYTVEMQQTKDAQIVAIAALKNLSNDIQFEVPKPCYAIYINPTTNASAAIVLDTDQV